MKLFEISEILKAEVLMGKDMLDQTVVGGGSADLMDDVLSAVTKGSVLLTGIVSEQVIRTAKIAGVSCVVFVRGKEPGKSVLDLADSHDITIMVTGYSMFVSSGRLYMNGLRGLDGAW